MTTIFAIDPGPEQSAFVEYRPNRMPLALPPIRAFGYVDNRELANRIEDFGHSGTGDMFAVIEEMQAMGMPVGRPVFLTCEWIGRFDELWRAASYGRDMNRITHSQVKTQLCGTAQAKYKNLRAVLYDRFGGSRSAACGTKKNPGPLYGFKGDDLISALSIAIAWHERNSSDEDQPE